MRQLRPIDRDAHLRMLFRQLPGAVWTTDRNLYLTYVTGRTADNMSPRPQAGMSVYDVVGSREPTEPFVAAHLAALAGEPQAFEHEVNGRWFAFFIEQLTHDGVADGCIGVAFDITEKRATQDKLAKSQALLAQAQRVAHIGSFEWEMATNKLTWSEELCRIYGVEPGQFKNTYEAFLERVHPDDLESTKTIVFDALRTGSPLEYEHRIIRADGTIRVIYTRGDIVTDGDRRPVRIAGCCWDMTELREAMDQKERTRSLLEATIEATADGFLVFDRDGRTTLYNRRFLELWRIPKEVMQHSNREKILAYIQDRVENDQEYLDCSREMQLHPEEKSFDILHLRDGRVFERFSRPQRIGLQIVGRVWSYRDITERETLLRRALFLADATRLLSSLNIEPALNSVANLAVPFIGDGCAIDLLGNGQPRRLVFVSRDNTGTAPELPGAVLGGHSVLYSNGTRSCMAIPLLVKDTVVGAMIFIARAFQRYRKADLEFAETLARRTALSVENARLYNKAQEALRSRDEFLTIAAHEIRGPITSVHMAVQGLQAGRVPTTIAPKLLEIIEREDRRLARFVDELLDLGRIQSGNMFFNFEDVDLDAVVRDAVRALGGELSRSGSALTIKTEGHPVGSWDKYSVTQVATNLLSNAIKFGQGKPIEIAVREHEGRTTLEVTDHGIGIQPQMLQRIFQPFERGVSVRNYGGLGLGLFIVRTIVEGLGGTVHVTSKPNEGSIFTVELKNERTREEK